MYESILLAVDGSETSKAATDHALVMGSALDATIHVLSVADTARDSVTLIGTEVVDALEREGQRIVEEVEARAREVGVSVTTEVRQGPPAATIVAVAEELEVDAIVIGTHGKRGLPRYLLGSVAERVVRTSPVPVVTIGPESLDADTEEE